jgi:hypothetical protein
VMEQLILVVAVVEDQDNRVKQMQEKVAQA